ncbi:MAG: hypothetical protein KBC95_01285 [Candidatus Peribacteraceae bacterium]|nr:hypothetical protein [Candidatus Peribacteraceae bacterium]
MATTTARSPEVARILTMLNAAPDALPFSDYPDLRPLAQQVITALAVDICGLDLLRLCSLSNADSRAALLRSALVKKRYPVRIERFEAACLELLPDHWALVPFTPAEVLSIVAEFRPTPVPQMLTWQKLSPRPLQTGRYWLAVAEAAIALPDWPAAWDAVRYALLGVPLTPNLEAEQLAEWNPWKTIDRLQDGRALAADLIAATAVLDRVFAALPSNSHKLVVRDDEIEMKPSDLARGDGWITGVLEITPFTLRARPGHEWPVKLKPSGQRVLAIARTVAEILAVRAAAAPNRPRSRRMATTVAS